MKNQAFSFLDILSVDMASLLGAKMKSIYSSPTIR